MRAFSNEARGYFEYGVEHFKEEARALARFNDHPGIVKVLNFFNDEGTGTAYIVMAYLDGMTLKDYLRSQGEKIPFETARNILMPVMDTLREVHSVGMLHRDISPDNIFITRSRNRVDSIPFRSRTPQIHTKGRPIIMRRECFGAANSWLGRLP